MKSERKGLGCGTTIALGLLLIVGAIFILPQLTGNNNNDVANDTGNDDVGVAQSVDDGIELGPIMISEQIDRDGCPTSTTDELENVDTFYVVAADSEVPEGTDIFVRLYQDGIAVEDLPVITANQNYSNSCINFVFETTDGFAFDEGSYEAEFWVNGNAYDSIRFEIQ